MLVLLGLVAAIVKPWGGGPAASVAVPPTPSPVPPTPVATIAGPVIGYGSLQYDPSIFGNHEPAAEWGLWPASFLITFGFVVQLGGDTPPAAPRSPRPSSAAPSPPSDGGPDWPSIYEVPEGNHLFLIGIDMPLGHRLTDVALHRLSGNRRALIQLSRLPSPWPSHFAVLGIPAAAGSNLLAVLTTGDYRLDLGFDGGAITRSIEIVVPALPGGG